MWNPPVKALLKKYNALILTIEASINKSKDKTLASSYKHTLSFIFWLTLSSINMLSHSVIPMA